MRGRRDATTTTGAGRGSAAASSIAPPSRAPVAQLDRVLPSEGRGHWFESSRARQSNQVRKDIVKSITYVLSEGAMTRS